MPRELKSVDSKVLENLCKTLSATKLPDNVANAELLRRQGGGPLVEDISDKPQSKKVTFFYYDEKKEFKEVYLQSQIRYLPSIIEKYGPPKKGEPPVLPMEPVSGSNNVWALTVELPTELCVEYSFVPKEKPITSVLIK